MKLTKGTLTVLKNYASINNSIFIRAGNTLRTLGPNKNIFAHFECSDSFPVDVALFDLNRFLGVVSLFDDPDFNFTATHVAISSGPTETRYVYADESHVLKAPEKDPKPVERLASVTLSNQIMKSLLDAAGVLRHTDMSLVGSGGKARFVIHDKKNPSTDEYKVAVGDTTNDFSFDFRVDLLKMVPADYTFEVHKLGNGAFVANLHPVKVGDAPSYWITTEASSTYTG